jgi:hypothetical protein
MVKFDWSVEGFTDALNVAVIGFSTATFVLPSAGATETTCSGPAPESAVCEEPESGILQLVTRKLTSPIANRYFRCFFVTLPPSWYLLGFGCFGPLTEPSSIGGL